MACSTQQHEPADVCGGPSTWLKEASGFYVECLLWWTDRRVAAHHALSEGWSM